MSATARRRALTKLWRGRLYSLLRALGPSMVSGASDTDPTTVATMAVVGSTTVYELSWLTVLTFPMLANVQLISARVGVVTRKGLLELVRRTFGRRWGFVLLASVLMVNIVTLAADLEGGAAALGLVLHVDEMWFSAPLGAALLALLVFGSYTRTCCSCSSPTSRRRFSGIPTGWPSCMNSRLAATPTRAAAEDGYGRRTDGQDAAVTLTEDERRVLRRLLERSRVEG